MITGAGSIFLHCSTIAEATAVESRVKGSRPTAVGAMESSVHLGCIADQASAVEASRE
jgi:hypothetical protein